jgi:hypothetical protein
MLAEKIYYLITSAKGIIKLKHNRVFISGLECLDYKKGGRELRLTLILLRIPFLNWLLRRCLNQLIILEMLMFKSEEILLNSFFVGYMFCIVLN